MSETQTDDTKTEKALDFNIRQKQNEDGSKSVIIRFPDNKDLQEGKELHKFVSATDGTEVWHIGEEVHYQDAPAVLIASLPLPTEHKFADHGFGQDWIIRSKYHRANGPAIIRPHGWSYWKMGMRHRIDGPALVDLESDIQKWFVNNKEIENVRELLEHHQIDPDNYENWTDAEKTVVRFAFS